MNANRQRWNEGHQKLNRALSAGDRDKAITLFLNQHAMLHSAKMSNSGLWSFEEEILKGMSDEQIRAVPQGWEHSIAWILLHLARIEDTVMNMLVAGKSQLFTPEGWGRKMNVDILHSTNSMDNVSVAALSAAINVKALLAYRMAVGKRTRQIVQKIKAEEFKQQVDPARLQKVMDAGAVSPDAMEIIRYWGSKTIAGLLLMPPTRHCMLHLNEAERIRKKLLK